MVESRSRILVGHDGDITYVGVEVDAEGGSLWSRILPLVRGRHLVLDFCGVSGDSAFLLQEVLISSFHFECSNKLLYFESCQVLLLFKNNSMVLEVHLLNIILKQLLRSQGYLRDMD